MSSIIIPTQEELDKLRGFTVGKWKEHKNYKCLYCQYSTLWKEKMEKHQADGDHPWAFPGQYEKVEGEVGTDDPRY